jgi:aminoglycoside phosphotransferase (APT) family kinase protein
VTHLPPEPRPYAAPYGATAQRPSWPSLPARLRALVEERLGQPVAEAVTQGGGFTNGFASRLLLADGSCVFVKAVSRLRSPEVFSCYQQEILVAGALPEQVPAPRLRWVLDHEDWLVLAFDDIAGRTPQRPWQPNELRAVLDMLTPLATAMTPAPVGLPKLDTTAGIDRDFSFWRRLVAGDVSADPQLVGARWLTRLEDLAALETDWAELAAGETAVHFDMRDDNLLITDDGRVLVCDWNWLTLAAPWVDLVGLLVSVHGDGLDAEAILADHPLTRGVEPRSINSFLSAMAGYFTEVAARPAFPNSPWMRTHQAWWRDATLSWLALRLQL